MTHLEKMKDLCRLMDEGKTMEAFEKYYHKEVEVIEADGKSRKGFEAQKEAIIGWQESVKEFHGGGSNSITANEEEGTTSYESWFDCTFQNGHRWKMEEVGVQKWQDGKIIRERFYYNVPG